MKTPKIVYTAKHAHVSDCGTFRWSLTREWRAGEPTCCFVMLNPSTADGTADDPTIRRCVRFADRMGCGALEVRNLYPLRATDPAELKAHPDPGGGVDGAKALLLALRHPVVVCGWGAVLLPDRLCRIHAKRVADFHTAAVQAGVSLKCLGTTKDGHPRHPLYVKADAELVPFFPPVATL